MNEALSDKSSFSETDKKALEGEVLALMLVAQQGLKSLEMVEK